MATNLASQLSEVAARSTNALNLKAQKAAHSKSLLFEPRVAASQSFDTIYAICHEGFQELCLLDGRFLDYQRSLFSPQSQAEERTMMTVAENADLDKLVEAFLGLVGGRLRLNPAIKAVEWLIRRFRIHEYNTSFVITTFLPYHTLPIFVTLLSILPANIPDFYSKFLHGHIRALRPPTRSDIVKATTTNPEFATNLNMYVIRISKARQHYPALLAFWAGIMTEAISGMLDKARSGRRGVQQQNEQDVLLRLIPTLNDGLALRKVPDLRIGCYMLLTVISSKGILDDKLLTAMMDAVVHGWTTETVSPALVCLSALAQHRGTKKLPKKVTKELLKIQDISGLLVEHSKQRRVDKLAHGFCLALVDRSFKHDEVSGIPVVMAVLENQLLSEARIAAVFKALLDSACQIGASLDTHKNLRPLLGSCLVRLARLSGHSGLVIQKTLNETNVDIDELEIKLHVSIRPMEIKALSDKMDVDIKEQDAQAATFSELYKQLPARLTGVSSFLSHNPSHIYSDLCQAFIASTANVTDLDLFDNAPILRRDSALKDTLYISFYARIWCGPYPVLARASALQMTTRVLSQSKGYVDLQAIIPYAIAGLGDAAAKVRGAAAELLITIEKLYPADLKKKANSLETWGLPELHGSGVQTEAIKTDIMARVLREMLLPGLEECVLDAKHIESLFQMSLNAPRPSEVPSMEGKKRLPQTARLSILSFLASYIINTPLFTVKLRLLNSLNQVRSIIGTTRTKFLLPALQHWASLKSAEALKHCQDENIERSEFDDQALLIVVANDVGGMGFLTSIINGQIAADRTEFMGAAFRRLQVIWPSLKGEILLKSAQILLDLSQVSPSNTSYNAAASEASADLLRALPLSTEILLSYLSQLPTAAGMADSPPTTKRRRTSHGEVARASIQDPSLLAATIRKVTFVLQLVDSSNPSTHPEILKDLFNTLAELQHFKAQVASELAFLQRLCLGSLLEILKAHKSNRNLKLDRSAVRADLLVDCVQKTGSPQVQNDALLLIAALAETAPELVLHSVMPIFTFMGSSVLRQSDEYSAHVIDQTIREVIPPLIASIRKERDNIVTGASDLLLSFVAAYEHVPPHRRRGLLISLVETLGAEDFLFALLAMLVDKYGLNENIRAFLVELSSSFSVEVQLQSVVKYLDLVSDILRPKPTYSAVLLNTNEEDVKDPHGSALKELLLLPHLLSQRRLISQTAKILLRDDMDAARVRDIYSTMLERVLALAETVNSHKQLHGACGGVLESLLGLLSTSEFVKAVEGLIERPSESLRRKILRSLEARIDQENSSDSASRTAMLGFLPQLTAIIRESKDSLYKHTAVACVDKISEKYGKKDLDAVTAAAEIIASKDCLGQSDDRLRVMALLCLASLVEILREGIVSVLPIAIPKALEYIQASLRDEPESQKLHNAGYAFMSSLVHHLPYMVSGAYLDKLLTISISSAEADLDDEADASREQCLQLAARQIDAKNMFITLERNWEAAFSGGAMAVGEYLNVLSTAIDKHPKNVVTKYSSVLSKIFQNAFDIRRKWAMAPEDAFDTDSLADIEEMVNEVAIKMIYKFNDTTFRPIFSSLVDWASNTRDGTERNLRLQSIYGFMAIFFDNLKSIVTSYATYLLDNSVNVLKTVNLKDAQSMELWSRALQTLKKCFEHDQDDFWQSPSHFGVIAPVLCEQFTHASSLPLIEDLVPAMVELAAAADSAEHHKELNQAILKHMRSEAASIRLAAIQCEQALTDRLGEEWLSMLPEMLPFISELQEDDDDVVEKETHKWIVKIEGVLGESLDSMLQ